MRVTLFGTGYVGLVTGTCFAEMGNSVLCVDIDAARVEALERGDIPMFEPGLERMVVNNAGAGRLRFTTDSQQGVRHGEVLFIAVGTPADEDGSADLSFVLAVAEDIGRHLEEAKIVVDKSTVPVGTADQVRQRIRKALAARGADIDFDVASNPEFLKEGAAVNDFMKPDRIIIGSERAHTREVLERLYAPFNRNHDKLVHMDVRSATSIRTAPAARAPAAPPAVRSKEVMRSAKKSPTNAIGIVPIAILLSKRACSSWAPRTAAGAATIILTMSWRKKTTTAISVPT